MKTLIQLVTVFALLTTSVVKGADFFDGQDAEYYKSNLSPSLEGFVQKQIKQLGAIPPPIFTDFKGFGSIENAINLYAVPNSQLMSVGVYQSTPDGFIDVSPPSNTNIRLKTKAEIDEYSHAEVRVVGSGALTNTMVDKEKEFRIFALTSRVTSTLGFVNYLYVSIGFYLTKSDEDGSYSLPDSLSEITMQLMRSMVYEIPNLEWARIEASYYPEREYPYLEIDSRINPPGSSQPPNDIDTSIKYIEISTEVATSGINGPYRLKISTSTKVGTNHVFKTYGSMGNQIEESPILINNFTAGTENVSFEVIGGDIGRVLQVQRATDPIGPWSNTGDVFVIRHSPQQFNRQVYGDLGFYRITSVNMLTFWTGR